MILYYFADGPQEGRYRGLEDVTEVVLESSGEERVVYQWSGEIESDARVLRVATTNLASEKKATKAKKKDK